MDDYSKMFREGDAARQGTNSFVYRNPITGETQEGVGEPPMNWGEYPDGIEPNSPEGDTYDLNRGLFRPLPDALFVPGGLDEIVEQPEGSQLDDPYWATASKILHDYLSPKSRSQNLITMAMTGDQEMTSEDYARYGVRFISTFENNITAMAVNTAQLSSAPMPVHKAMYYLLETGDRNGILASNFGRDALNMASDPFNWVGLTTFGIGTAGKMAGQKLTKMAFRDLLKQMVISKPTAASAALGAEGAVYAAADNLARQNVAVEAGVQDAIDPASTAAAGATGAVLGDRLGAGGAAVLEGGRRGIVKLGEGAQTRLDEAAGGTTLTSGVDPTKPIDQGLAAMGRAFDDAQARYFEQGNFEPPTAENPVSVVKPTEAEPGIIAFHGSGADFDEFRLEMIGTGEGAQAYGYGLYFTDSKDIAKFYKEASEEPRILQLQGQVLNSVYTADNEEKFSTYVNKNFPTDDHDDVYVVLDNLGQDLLSLRDADAMAESSFNNAQKKIYRIIRGDLVEPEVGAGKLYKVALTPKPDDMLDYQTRFKDQPDAVQAALIKAGYEVDKDKTGQMNSETFKALRRDRPMPMILDFLKTSIEREMQAGEIPKGNPSKVLSERLFAEGVPGIKYRAAGSRGANLDAADAEFNYVIFDDKAIKILEKYGIAGPIAVTAVAGASNNDNDGGDSGDT